MIHYSIATIEDLPRIVAIYNQSILTKQSTADVAPITMEDKVAWFEAHDPKKRPLWIMQEAGEIIGWISLSDFYGRPAYDQTVEISIYIDETYQHRGIGQYAMDFVEKQLSGLGIETVLAFIFDSNQASQRLFEKNGYCLWGLLPEVAQIDERLIGLAIWGKSYR
ncbi:GNAT family N-acetyltransferase [Enterococcus hirae]|uniref:GNAT family N-acetyltransferase n=1 Tax=Enterococcus hirae TaxID=1354 RepID=UPI001A96E113|nr:GNAT family N-acetyltransferase [Enterococcus hirae]MBO1101226.1 N-acetyltransferase [Enterococcus hirae]